MGPAMALVFRYLEPFANSLLAEEIETARRERAIWDLRQRIELRPQIRHRLIRRDIVQCFRDALVVSRNQAIGVLAPQQLPVTVYKLSLITIAESVPSWLGITAMRRSMTIKRLKNSSRVRTSAPAAVTAAT